MADKQIYDEIPEPEDLEKAYNFAQRIVAKVLEEAAIPELSTRVNNLPPKPRWERYFRAHEKHFEMWYFFATPFDEFCHTYSLTMAAMTIVTELRQLLSSDEAKKVFVVDEADFEEIIFDESKAILRHYLDHLITVLYQGIYSSFKEVCVGYLKQFIEPRLREDWAEQGLGEIKLAPNKDFSTLIQLSPPLNIFTVVEQIDEEFQGYRKIRLGSRKGWLTTDVQKTLPEKYEQLRLGYVEAKKEYQKQYAAFLLVHQSESPASVEEKWRKHWEEVFSTQFGDLFLATDKLSGQTMKLSDFTPAELARAQIGDLFDYSPEYIKKLIEKSETRPAKAKEDPKNKPDDTDLGAKT